MNRLIGEIRGLNEKDRTAEVVISSERRDRHKTIIPLDSWNLESYSKNPIVAFQHDAYGDGVKGADPDSIIGKSTVYKDYSKRQLIAHVEFEPAEMNPLAEKVWQKILKGTLSSASVGFLPLQTPAGKWGKDQESQNGSNPTYYYGPVELLEWSIVTIPSNADATVLRSLERLEPFTDHKEGKSFNPDLELMDARLKMAGIIPTKKQKDLLRMKIDLGLAGIDTKSK